MTTVDRPKRLISVSADYELMRNVSGLCMKDPVFGDKEKSVAPSHPSILFDDMSLGDVPEDMRDMVSIASDPTAVLDSGLDSEMFHCTLTGMQVTLTDDFSASELLSMESSANLEVALERLGGQLRPRKHGKGSTKNSYVSTKADPLGLCPKHKRAGTSVVASSDDTTTSETLPSTRCGASVGSLTWQDLVPAHTPLITKVATTRTQLSACQSGDENETGSIQKLDPDTDPSANTPLQQSNSSINAEAWEEQVKLVSQKLDLTKTRAPCFRRNSMGPTMLPTTKCETSIIPRKARRRSFCAMLGLSPRKEKDTRQALDEYQAELLVAMKDYAETCSRAPVDNDDTSCDPKVYVDVEAQREDDASALTVADPRRRIDRTPYVVPVAPPLGMKPRRLPTIAALFPEDFVFEESPSFDTAPPTNAAGTVLPPLPMVSVHSFFGDEEDTWAPQEKVINTSNRYFESTHAVKSAHVSVVAH